MVFRSPKALPAGAGPGDEGSVAAGDGGWTELEALAGAVTGTVTVVGKVEVAAGRAGAEEDDGEAVE